MRFLVLFLVALFCGACNLQEGDFKSALRMAKAGATADSEVCFTIYDPTDLAGRYCLRFAGVP